MSNYPNPNPIVEAIYTDGATHNPEIDCLVHNGQNKHLVLVNGVWDLTTGAGDKINAAVFGQLGHPATTVIGTEYGEEYEFIIAAPGGFKQLISQGGYATLLDP